MSADPSSWQIPAAHPALGPDQVHLWRSRLDLPAATVASLGRLLSGDELERAQRLVFERDRRRFIVARGLLRLLLARYTGSAARDLVFGYEARGKPFLAGPAGVAAPAFNLAHAEEWAAYGFTLRGPIGVDIEYHTALEDMGQLAATIFSEHEQATLEAVPAHQRLAAFYAGWTRKEAFVKALGAGLSFPLAGVEVALHPAEPARILRVRAELGAIRQWQLVAFSPAHAVSGAVVVAGQPPQITRWDFPHAGARLDLGAGE